MVPDTEGTAQDKPTSGWSQFWRPLAEYGKNGRRGPVPWPQTLVIWALMGLFFQTFLFIMNASMHSRDNLRAEYEEVFITPFASVTVDDYWNANLRHGNRFKMLVHSQTPLELRHPKMFKEMPVADFTGAYYSKSELQRKHPDWQPICFYNEQRVPGEIWVFFNQTKNDAEVVARTRGSIPATTRSGKPLGSLLSNYRTLEFTTLNAAYDNAYSYRLVNERMKIFKWGPASLGILVNSKLVDPRLETPRLFEEQLMGFVKELKEYDGGKDVKDKLFELQIPDAAISEEQVEALNRVVAHIKENNTKLAPGEAPMRMKLLVAVKQDD